MSEDLKEIGAEALRKKEEPKKESVPIKPKRDLSPEEAEKIREQKRQRIAQVLSRGILNEKLAAIYEKGVPEGSKGKFVLDREEDIVRYQNLGFTFQYKEEVQGLHASADGRIRVGDVVLMTITAEDHEILQEIRRDSVRKKLDLGRKEYLSKAQQEAEEGGATPFDESVQTISKG